MKRKNARILKVNDGLYTEYQKVIKKITACQMVKSQKDASKEDIELVDEKLTELRKKEKNLAETIIFNDKGIYRGRI